MEPCCNIILKKKKDESLLRFHPWVFSGAIQKQEGAVREGNVVRVFSNDGRFLGTGHYQPGSIAVRIFSFDDIKPDFSYWKEKIRKAWQLRMDAGLFSSGKTNVFRLVNAEGDGMPGLVIDFYAGVAVMQMHSVGMYLIRDQLAEALRVVLGDRLTAVYDKSEKTLPFKAETGACNGYLLGDAIVPHTISENGLFFSVDWITGQKTGFFIDQRENRALLENLSLHKKVLNMFCYTGGFSVYAMRGKASLVHSVDSSQKAVMLTNENISRNFTRDERHTAFVTDAFDFLKQSNDSYDLIILDPPAFAKHQDVLPQALKAYKRLNAAALNRIAGGGILFTFSCSQVVPRDRFREAVFSAAAISKREISILYQLTQPADHPVSIYHPEGEYLKGLVLYVE
jgi:23S rRNA (cytosine1962-C5)-methyltransferase